MTRSVVDRLEQVGEIARTEARLFRIEKATRAAELAVLEAQAQQAELRLRQLMGMSPEAPLRLGALGVTYAWSAVQHPVLRIVMAIVVGLWSPMCCCRASMLLAGIGDVELNSAAGDATHECCSVCCGDDAGAQHCADPAPAADSDSHDPCSPKCPNCPSCMGPMGDAALAASARVALDGSDAPAALAVFGVTDPSAWTVALRSPTARNARWTGPPVHMRASRAALRWHCALNV